jgi:flagellar hook-length control protein FliK
MAGPTGSSAEPRLVARAAAVTSTDPDAPDLSGSADVVATGVAPPPIAPDARPAGIAAPDAAGRPQPAAPELMRDQVTRPLLALASAGNGDHTVTISVTPDSLGPVIVRAHISDGQVRLELFAPNDPGRESLRQLLPDLRRDLASTDLSATLDLSSQSGPSAGEGQDRSARMAWSPNELTPSGRQSDAGEPVGSRTLTSPLALDVLA